MVLFLRKYKFKKSLYIRYNSTNNKIFNKIISKKYKPNKKIIGNGKNTIISYGVCVEQIFKILHQNAFLQKKYELYNFSLISDLSKTFFLALSKKSKNLLIFEDHMSKGSLAEKIKLLAYENNIKTKMICKNLGSNYFRPKKTLNELFEDYDITKEYLINLKL
jgi:deoxyxylulose-5-phosphate synthase